MNRLPMLLLAAAFLTSGCGSATTTKPGVAAYAIWGTVRDSASAVVSGANVTAMRRVSASLSEMRLTQTDGAGRFAFADAATGDYELAAALPGLTRVAGAAFLVPPSRTTLELALQRPCVVVGTIQGPPARRPAGAADVSVACLVSYGFASDPAGDFALPGVPSGSWRVTASRIFGNSVKETTITVPAGADTVHLPPIWLP